MNVQAVLNEMIQLKKATDELIKQLKEISTLDTNRTDNLGKLRSRVPRLEKVITNLEKEQVRLKSAKEAVSTYQQELNESEEQTRKKFGLDLEHALKEQNLTLTGQIPLLKAGLFTIKLDFVHWQAGVWYGPGQQELARTPISAEKVATQIQQLSQALGSKLPEEKFLGYLFNAYSGLASSSNDSPQPINQIFEKIKQLVLPPQPLDVAPSRTQPEYRRADFSYDLYRLRRAKVLTLADKRLHLVVATRAYTRRPADNLWIPEDDRGNGSRYSHVQFEESAS